MFQRAVSFSLFACFSFLNFWSVRVEARDPKQSDYIHFVGQHNKYRQNPRAYVKTMFSGYAGEYQKQLEAMIHEPLPEVVYKEGQLQFSWGGREHKFQVVNVELGILKINDRIYVWDYYLPFSEQAQRVAEFMGQAQTSWRLVFFKEAYASSSAVFFLLFGGVLGLMAPAIGKAISSAWNNFKDRRNQKKVNEGTFGMLKDFNKFCSDFRNNLDGQTIDRASGASSVSARGETIEAAYNALRGWDSHRVHLSTDDDRVRGQRQALDTCFNQVHAKLKELCRGVEHRGRAYGQPPTVHHGAYRMAQGTTAMPATYNDFCQQVGHSTGAPQKRTGISEAERRATKKDDASREPAANPEPGP